jgi:hypothetical protein
MSAHSAKHRVCHKLQAARMLRRSVAGRAPNNAICSCEHSAVWQDFTVIWHNRRINQSGHCQHPLCTSQFVRRPQLIIRIHPGREHDDGGAAGLQRGVLHRAGCSRLQACCRGVNTSSKYRWKLQRFPQLPLGFGRVIPGCASQLSVSTQRAAIDHAANRQELRTIFGCQYIRRVLCIRSP